MISLLIILKRKTKIFFLSNIQTLLFVDKHKDKQNNRSYLFKKTQKRSKIKAFRALEAKGTEP